MDSLTNKQIAELLSKDSEGSAQLVNDYARNIAKEYLNALNDIKKRIAKMFEDYGDNVRYSDMVKYNRLVSMQKQITDILNGMNKKVTYEITAAIKDQFSYFFYHTGYSLESVFTVSLGFGILNPDVIKAAILNPMDYITWTERQKQHVTELVGKIRTEITQGLIKGKGYGEIAKAIENRTGITYRKSVRIVNTETHRAQSMGFNKAFEKAKKTAQRLGVKIKKVWIATLDDKTRNDHREMDGKNPHEDGFYYFPEGWPTIAPGLSGIPEEDINCRCTEGIEIIGVNTKYRSDNISKKTTVITDYNDWKQNHIINS